MDYYEYVSMKVIVLLTSGKHKITKKSKPNGISVEDFIAYGLNHC